jgi:ribosomal protein L7Ae-like RNA K-turn-binding protein
MYVFFFLCFSLVVIGGDVSPVDVLTHIPILCEDNDVPYVYVPSRSELGQSAQTKRATTLVLVRAPPAGASRTPRSTNRSRKQCTISRRL